MSRFTVHRGEQQDDAWRRLRLGCATGSGFADVLAKGKNNEEALGRRNYRVRLAVELLTGTPEAPGYMSAAMRAGVEREPEARARFEAESGIIVDTVSFLRLNHMPVGCSPDSLIDLSETASGVTVGSGLEVKCPTKAVHWEYLQSSAPPTEYVPQIQGCMLVTGTPDWHFVSFNPDFPPELQYHHILVRRDDVFIKRLEDELWRFTSDVKRTVREMEQMIADRRAAGMQQAA